MKTLRNGFAACPAKLRTFYQQARTFVLHDIWLMDPSTASYVKGCVLRYLQVVLIVLRGFFREHQCLLRASALTYTTLLVLVPMLAFMFAFLKGLGVQNILEPLLIDKLSVGSEETVRLIINYVNNIRVGTLGVIGLASLLFSTILQLGTIEQALNEIWGVREGRSILRKITDYVSVMVFAPITLLFAITFTAALKNQALITKLLEKRLIGDAMVLVFTLLPFVALWMAFTAFYAFLPNTRVKIGPAFIGGFIGGTLWQLAQWVYIEFQVGMAKYHAIYGAFAQLPVLMIWLYISWVIVLLGAEVTFACQNAATYSLERFVPLTSFHTKERLASSLFFSLSRAFLEGKGPWSAVAFAQQHRIPIRLMREVLGTLIDEKLIIEAAEEPEHYVPGRDPATISPWHILYALRHHGDPAVEERIELHDAVTTTLLCRLQEAEKHVAGSRSITQWLAEKNPVSEML
jgi:membrane protein